MTHEKPAEKAPKKKGPAPHEYQRVKRYPSPKLPVQWAIGTALTTTMVAAGFHFGSDFVNSNPDLHNAPVLGGFAQFVTEGAPQAVLGAMASGVRHLPFVGQYADVAPNLLMHNPASEALGQLVNAHVPYTHNLVRPDDLVTAEGLGALTGTAAGIGAGAVALWKLPQKPEIVNKPAETYLQQADAVIAKLNPRGRTRGRYANLNRNEVAVELEAAAKDMKKASTEKSAVLAPTVAKIWEIPFLRAWMTEDRAAQITLNKEIYKRMPSGFLRGIWDINNSGLAGWIKRIPGAGGTYDGFVESGDFLVGLIPKRDLDGKFHLGLENIPLNLFALGLGTLVEPIPFLSFVTSDDVKESVEIRGREQLAKGAPYTDKHGRRGSRVDDAARAIIGTEVKRHPRRYSVA